jgi:hypothetical protein
MGTSTWNDQCHLHEGSRPRQRERPQWSRPKRLGAGRKIGRVPPLRHSIEHLACSAVAEPASTDLNLHMPQSRAAAGNRHNKMHRVGKQVVASMKAGGRKGIIWQGRHGRCGRRAGCHGCSLIASALGKRSRGVGEVMRTSIFWLQSFLLLRYLALSHGHKHNN